MLAAVLPHSDDMMALASAGIFALKMPEHEISKKYNLLAKLLLA